MQKFLSLHGTVSQKLKFFFAKASLVFDDFLTYFLSYSLLKLLFFSILDGKTILCSFSVQRSMARWWVALGWYFFAGKVEQVVKEFY